MQSCGPTCLHAIYGYLGHELPLASIIDSVDNVAGGGTVAVFLACDALRRGFDASIYTYNLQVFDPTWFDVPGTDIAAKLSLQMRAKTDARLQAICQGYIDFLAMGGRLRFVDLTRKLLRGFLTAGLPVLTGLSATYLYRSAREIGDQDTADDVRGAPVGHFVVLEGYDRSSLRIAVCDPLLENPLGEGHRYEVHIDRVIGAILLGVVTHDANLLVIERRTGRRAR